MIHRDPYILRDLYELEQKIKNAKTRKKVICPICKGKGEIRWVESVECYYCDGKGHLWMFFKPSTWKDEWWQVVEEVPLEEKEAS